MMMKRNKTREPCTILRRTYVGPIVLTLARGRRKALVKAAWSSHRAHPENHLPLRIPQITFFPYQYHPRVMEPFLTSKQPGLLPPLAY